MRKFQFVEPNWGGPNEFAEENTVTITFSESYVAMTYYDYWYEKMCIKFGKQYVDTHYCFEDCLEDFCTIHWATELK